MGVHVFEFDCVYMHMHLHTTRPFAARTCICLARVALSCVHFGYAYGCHTQRVDRQAGGEEKKRFVGQVRLHSCAHMCRQTHTYTYGPIRTHTYICKHPRLDELSLHKLGGSFC